MSLAYSTRGGAWDRARDQARNAVSSVAQRVLPDATVRLHHVEADLRLHVHLRRDLPVWSGGLARFEAACVRVLRAAVSDGDVAIDVGAKIGFFSTLFSRWAGEEGRVLAIEPDAVHLDLLRRNLDDNFCENVVIYQEPVGSRRPDHEVLLAVAGLDGRRRVPAPGGMPELLPRDEPETIDRIVDDEDAFPALIKLDLGGGEGAALAGARYTLVDCRPIVAATLAGEDGRQVMETLHWAGYRVYDVESGRPHEAGPRPQAIVALPSEGLRSARGLAVIAALDGGAGR